MIMPDGFVKIMDFGRAKVYEADSDRTRTVVKQGTVKYMSPEHVQLKSDIDYKLSDIYPLGMTFYEMLAGRTPFDKGAVETTPNAKISCHGSVDFSDSLVRLLPEGTTYWVLTRN